MGDGPSPRGQTGSWVFGEAPEESFPSQPTLLGPCSRHSISLWMLTVSPWLGWPRSGFHVAAVLHSREETASPRVQVVGHLQPQEGFPAVSLGSSLSPGEDKGTRTVGGVPVIPSFTAHGPLYVFVCVLVSVNVPKGISGAIEEMSSTMALTAQSWGWGVGGELVTVLAPARTACPSSPSGLLGKAEPWQSKERDSVGSAELGERFSMEKPGDESSGNVRPHVERRPRVLSVWGGASLSSVLRHPLGCELDSGPGTKCLPGQR